MYAQHGISYFIIISLLSLLALLSLLINYSSYYEWIMTSVINIRYNIFDERLTTRFF